MFKLTQNDPLVVSFVHYEAPVGKPYGYEDGKVTKGKNYRSEKAGGETLEFESSEAYFSYRKTLPSTVIQLSGTFETVGEVPVVFKGKEGTGEVSASKTFLAHREQPGILIIDIDYKEQDEVAGLFPDGLQPFKTKQAALDALYKVMPEARGCAYLIGWSTSSNLFKDGEQVKGTGGIRIYLAVTDASKIPWLLDILHKRSWLNGEGWAFVDKASRLQERSLVDQKLKEVQQPDYAAPDLQDGVTQERDWEERAGEYLNPADIEPLTLEEEAQYAEAVAVAKAALGPEMAAQRRVWLDAKGKELEKKGVDKKRAMAAAVQLLDNGILSPDSTVFFDDGSEVCALELLTDGSAYDGKTCKDPVEPDYNGGASVGCFYWNDGLRPGIHSFAHGSKWLEFKFDAEQLKKAIKGGDKDTIIRALALCELSGVDYALFELEANKQLGLGKVLGPLRLDVAALKVQIADAVPKARPSDFRDLVLLDPKTPTDSAAKYLKERHSDGSTQTLVDHSETFYKYTGTHYQEEPRSAVRADLYDFLGRAKQKAFGDNLDPINPNMRLVTEIMDAVKAKSFIPATAAPPYWFDGRDGPAPDELLACRNGLLRMPTGELLPHDAALFSLNALNYDYDADAPEPVCFFKFLDDLYGDDPEAEDLLQEIFGYILSGDCSYQKIPLIIGPKRSGKGTLGRVLVELVGAANSCSPRLESIGSRFGLQPLIGKKLACMSDFRLKPKADQHAIAENLLRVSGEDDVNVERKGITDWHGRLLARFVMMSNELPRIAESSGALAGRFVVLHLTKSFWGREDKELTAKLLTELPGVLLWALEGWARLQAQGQFTEPASSKVLIASLRRLTSPIQAFVDDTCVVAEGAVVKVDDIFAAYQGWSRNENRNYPGTKESFAQQLFAAVPGLQKFRPREGDERPYSYRGIGLVVNPGGETARPSFPFPVIG